VELGRLVDGARLYRDGGRGLLQPKELDRIGQWQKDNLPSTEWAQRYVTLDEWNEVEAFIKQSTEHLKQRKLEQELQQRREAEMEYARHREYLANRVATKMRRLAFAAAGTAAAATILLVISIGLWLSAQKQTEFANEQRLVAESARVAAEEQTKVATAQRLANASSALTGKDLQISLLLAVEAVKAAESAKVRVAAAEQSRRPPYRASL
jgi:hypothetical protein